MELGGVCTFSTCHTVNSLSSIIALLVISDAVEKQGAAACLLRVRIEPQSCLHPHAVANHTCYTVQCFAVPPTLIGCDAQHLLSQC